MGFNVQLIIQTNREVANSQSIILFFPDALGCFGHNGRRSKKCHLETWGSGALGG